MRDPGTRPRTVRIPRGNREIRGSFAGQEGTLYPEKNIPWAGGDP